MTLHITPFYGTDYTASGVTLDAWVTKNSSQLFPDNTSTWYTTNDATFEFTGVQLEVGSVPTEFEHRTYGDELARCQRYYYKHAFGTSVAPAGQPGNDDYPVGMCAIYTTSNGFGYIQYPVTMRALPTLDVATGSGYYDVYANNGNDGFNDVGAQKFGTTCAVVNYTDGFSKDTGHAGWIQVDNANAYIAFSAEL